MPSNILRSPPRKRGPRLGDVRVHSASETRVNALWPWVPAFAQGCPENDSLCHGACPAVPAQTGTFWLSRLRKGPSMRFRISILASLLKPISRRRFAATVERHDGDAYDKSFRSWDQLVTLIFAQLGAVESLRELVTVWNANSHHHYHLGAGKLRRSTLADANARRPIEVFVETFAGLSGLADRVFRRKGRQMLRLIDATPIP